MTSDRPRNGTRTWLRRYLAGLDSAASGNAQAFGFSILITVSYGAVSSSHRTPTVLELFGFALAAVAVFSLVNLVTAWLTARHPNRETPRRIVLVATATDFVAVGAGVAAAIGVARACAGWPGWVLPPAAAGLVYALVQALEFAVGRAEAGED